CSPAAPPRASAAAACSRSPSASSATSSRPASAAATRATSGPCSASPVWPARCWAAGSPTPSAGAGSSTSTSPSAWPRLWPPRAAPNVAVGPRDHRIDYLGAAAIVGAVTCLLLYLDWRGNDYGWTEAGALT